MGLPFCYASIYLVQGGTVTKTEVKGLGVDDLRELLDEHLEGITEEMTKEDLKAIVDDNWDFLDSVLNPVEEEDAQEEGEEEVEEAEADDEEEVPAEIAELLKKDLYTNKPSPVLLGEDE